MRAYCVWNQLTGELKYFLTESSAEKFVEESNAGDHNVFWCRWEEGDLA